MTIWEDLKKEIDAHVGNGVLVSTEWRGYRYEIRATKNGMLAIYQLQHNKIPMDYIRLETVATSSEVVDMIRNRQP